MRFVTALMLFLAAAAPAAGQPLVDVRVTSVSDRSVFIDAGRNAGIVSGSRLVIILSNGARLEATVIDVAANSARAELAPQEIRRPQINDRGEIAVTPIELPTPPGEAPPAAPVHPPWKRQEGERSPDMPLLAPAYATRPQDRPRSIHGRVYTSLRGTRDLESDNTFTYGRLGTWFEVDNPFHDAGRILFAGETDYRGTSLTDGDQNDTVTMVDRFSYAGGLDEHSPYRFEFGRYYSSIIPELGLIDGGEGMLRFQNGWTLGGGGGFYPLPNDERDTGEDYGFHVFADYESSDVDRPLNATLAYQQTWHNGRADRNSLIARASARPVSSLWLYGFAIVDFYGEGDSVKDRSVDLTELVLQATWNVDTKTGVNASVTRTTWPELKRTEYVGLPDRLVRDGYVDRVSGSVWRRVTENIRLSGRAHYWMDQDADGVGGELGADWYGALGEFSSVFASVYFEETAYAPGYGLRAQVVRDFRNVRVLLGYDLFAYSLDDVAGTDDYIRHTIRGDVGYSAGRWSADMEAVYSFGDNENAVSIGVYGQYRF